MNNNVSTANHFAPAVTPPPMTSFTSRKGKAAFFADTGKIVFQEGEETIDLSYSATKTLEILISNAGTVISREDLFEYAWSGRVVTQNSLNQVISQLREAIGDDTEKQVIRTVSRIGYVFGRNYLSEDVELSSPMVPFTSKTEQALPEPHDSTPDYLHPLFKYFPFNIKLSNRLLFLIISLSSLALWMIKLDLGLLLPTDIAVQEEFVQNTQVIYVAASAPALKQLKGNVLNILELLSAKNTRNKTIVINDSVGYYDVYCLKPAEPPSFIFIAKTAALTPLAETFQRCMN